jgi:co-chaperonin GroES (HSP10)
MNFRPVNGYILVEREQEKGEAPLILIPTEYSPRGENFVKLKVISIRADNPLSLYSGSYILTRESMVEEINVDGQIYHLVLKNHILGVFSDEQD